MADYITEVKTAWEILNTYKNEDGDDIEYNIRIDLLQRTSKHTYDTVVSISQGKRDASIGLFPKNIDLSVVQCEQMVDILNLALDKTKENEV